MDKIKEFVFQICDNLCVAGGVSYNGYMNEEFTKTWKNVYVPPAVGDEGQALGTYQHADYVLNGNKHAVSTYAGKAYDWKPNKDEEFEWGYEQLFWQPLNMKRVAKAIANGKTVGWFQGRM